MAGTLQAKQKNASQNIWDALFLHGLWYNLRRKKFKQSAGYKEVLFDEEGNRRQAQNTKGTKQREIWIDLDK